MYEYMYDVKYRPYSITRVKITPKVFVAFIILIEMRIIIIIMITMVKKTILKKLECYVKINKLSKFNVGLIL